MPTIELTDEWADHFVTQHPYIYLALRRVRGGWVAEIDGTQVCPLPHQPMPLSRLRLTLATRYLASVGDRTAHINTSWARKLPNWIGKYGALPELAAAVRVATRKPEVAYAQD